jgi:hypothetical protein
MYSQPSDNTPPRPASDHPAVAAVIVVCLGLIARVASTLFPYLLSYSGPEVRDLTTAVQAFHLVVTLLTIVAVGFLVGKVAPRSAPLGILIGNATGFLLGVAYWFFLLVPALRGKAPPYPPILLQTLTWLAAITAAELLLARWVAARDGVK